MLKEFIEEQFNSILLDKDAGALDKALYCLVLFTYGLTAPQLQKYITLIINVVFPGSSDSEEIYLNVMASILTIAVYFLLIYASRPIRSYAYTVRYDIWVLISKGLDIKSRRCDLFKEGQYDRNIVLTSQVRRYLDINEDERVKQLYKNHHEFVYYLVKRKDNAMAISLMLFVNFYINYEALLNYAKLYWLVVISLALWSTLIPEDDINFMYIYNNKIRVKESLQDSNYPSIQ
jgi:hypothetical protein